MKKYLLSVLVLGLVFVAGNALSSTIKLNPIKPVGSGAPLTDEQQAILAVRTAKASVVNILGLSKPNPQLSGLSNSSVSVTINQENEVSGTGFVIDSNGLVVTNNHVVDDTSLDYFVIMPDGTQYPATILGQDKYDDIALLKIDVKNLTAAHLGDSDSLETGQTVFTIGNSLGRYQNTVTRGVVSGLSRSVNPDGSQGLPTSHNWIQTDAAINLGNSGGPLINMAGEVVGMDTLVDTSGSSLGFAIPVNAIKDAVNQLKTFGKVSRPFLGVKFLTIDSKVQLSKNLPVKDGALIAEVVAGSPAKTAGILPSDIVVGMDNYVLNSQNTLDLVIQKYQAGQQVVVKILRNGQKIDLPLVLGKQD